MPERFCEKNFKQTAESEDFRGLWASSGFWQMLLATLLLAFNWTTIMPLIEAVAVSGVRSAGLDYGRVRLWGSGSFILASFACGLIIGQYGAASVLPLLVAAATMHDGDRSRRSRPRLR